jgi:hypothetical protein
VLEFGCEQIYLSLMAARKGFHVVALDLEEQGLSRKDSLVDILRERFSEVVSPREPTSTLSSTVRPSSTLA